MGMAFREVKGYRLRHARVLRYIATARAVTSAFMPRDYHRRVAHSPMRHAIAALLLARILRLPLHLIDSRLLLDCH